MSEVTHVLSRMHDGDPSAAEELLPLVYDELRTLAAAKLVQERPGQTLQATALVHEAYLRLVGDEQAQRWDNRRHFYAAAAEAMRRILIEEARRKQSLRRGGAMTRIELDDAAAAPQTVDPATLLTLDEALSKLAAIDSESAKLVNLRYFAGLSVDEAAAALGVSARTAKRNWSYARAWLQRELERDR